MGRSQWAVSSGAWHSSLPSARAVPVAGSGASGRRGARRSAVSVVTQAQRRDECLLGHLHPADVLHLLLALFLLLEQFALASDVTAVALGQHIFALGLARPGGHDAPADGRLD